MPRPKVDPQNRQRAAEACHACRSRKQRCSGTSPCTNCIRHSRECILIKRGDRAPLNAGGARKTSANANAQQVNAGGQIPSPRSIGSVTASATATTEAGTEMDQDEDGECESDDVHPSLSTRTSPIVTKSSASGTAAAAAVPSAAVTANTNKRIRLESRTAAAEELDGAFVMSSMAMGGLHGNGNGLGHGHGYPVQVPEARHKTQARMLRNLMGERVFIGGAASISFLQLIRDTVTHHIGPSSFSHYNQSDSMLETATAKTDISGDCDQALSLEQKQSLVRTYFIATRGFIDVISTSEAHDLIAASDKTYSPSPTDRPMAFATADLLLAIGLQCSKSTPALSEAEKFYFSRGQARAFASMLEDPTLELVRVFILMAFYMLGACRRNAAFMYLGVATRVGIALGLHSSENTGARLTRTLPVRLRVWMSVCTLDLLVSSILGRPSATAALRKPLHLTLDSRFLAENHDIACILASYEIVDLIQAIVDQLYGKKTISTAAAELLLERLQDWSARLPPVLRTSPTGEQEDTDRHEQTLGNVNVACLYYFAVTLVTRPFLISTLTARLSSQREAYLDKLGGNSIRDDAAGSKMATACLDSAIFLIQTCVDAFKSQLLLPNMCMLKALIFAAALILGFAMFAQREVDFEIEAAFTGARDILSMLSPQSQQASHYHEILTLLSQAILRQREELANRAARRKSGYVGRILDIDIRAGGVGGSSSALTTGEAMTQSTPRVPSANASALPSGLNSPFRTATPTAAGEGSLLDSWMQGQTEINLDENGFLGWDSLELPLWDNFPFTSDSFATPE